MASSAYVYILTNRRRGVLYTGVTKDLPRRVFDHRVQPHGFVRCYGLYELVYYTGFREKWYAIEREKAMKRWLRRMKIERIEAMNPYWEDLAADWEYITDQGEVIVLGCLPKQKPRRVARHCYKYAWHRRKYL